MYASETASPLGTITLASDGKALVGLWLEGQKYFAASVKGALERKDDLLVFALVRDWLTDYFSGRKPAIAAVPLAPAGSAFRSAVWDILRDIPYGQCTTYGAIAKTVAARMGRTGMSGQAVGGAVGHNPVSIIIPCHRVVGSSGSLTGYAGGIDKKIKLLELEGVGLSRYVVPLKGTAL